MAARPISAFRTLNRTCIGPMQLRKPTVSGLSPLTQTFCPHSRQATVLELTRALQRRYQTTSSSKQETNKGHESKKGPEGNPGRPPSFWAFLRQALSFGRIFRSFTPSGLRALYQQHPIEVVLAIAIFVAVGGVSAYVAKEYITSGYFQQFHTFPAPVAQSLRRALYYTNMSPDPKLARKWYKKALEQCDEHGLDPFSDEVLGIRIQTAAWLEKIGNYTGAITVLDAITKDCLKWITVMEKAMTDGTVDKSGNVSAPTQKKQGEEGSEDEAVPLENLWHKRNRLLAKAIGMSTKLGELYGDEHVNDSENSHTRLSWAVEAGLTEARRRATVGVKPEEGDWLKPEEFGGTMEALARHYEAKSQFHLALPLLFHALRLCDSPCHRPVIMNNMAVAFAQHPVMGYMGSIPGTKPASRATSNPDMPTTREGLLEAAANWARNAKRHAEDVKDSKRTPECDEACVVALSNLGDIAALRGKEVEARKWFQECIKLSTKIGFEQGVTQAEAGLRNLSPTGSS